MAVPGVVVVVTGTVVLVPPAVVVGPGAVPAVVVLVAALPVVVVPVVVVPVVVVVVVVMVATRGTDAAAFTDSLVGLATAIRATAALNNGTGHRRDARLTAYRRSASRQARAPMPALTIATDGQAPTFLARG